MPERRYLHPARRCHVCWHRIDYCTCRNVDTTGPDTMDAEVAGRTEVAGQAHRGIILRYNPTDHDGLRLMLGVGRGEGYAGLLGAVVVRPWIHDGVFMLPDDEQMPDHVTIRNLTDHGLEIDDLPVWLRHFFHPSVSMIVHVGLTPGETLVAEIEEWLAELS